MSTKSFPWKGKDGVMSDGVRSRPYAITMAIAAKNAAAKLRLGLRAAGGWGGLRPEVRTIAGRSPGILECVKRAVGNIDKRRSPNPPGRLRRP
jgi:hypothetical protein